MPKSSKFRLWIHKQAYFFSILLPLNFLWRFLHNREYHPDVDGIVSRIQKSKSGSDSSLFQKWETQLDILFHLEGKTVLEIGHGGGWYLAQALDAGASHCVGYEISERLNSRATTSLQQLGYQKFRLITGNGRSLAALKGQKFDFIFSITVLQHLPTRITRRYLRDIGTFINENGSCVIQVLHSYNDSVKRLSLSDLFSVAYSEDEFLSLLKRSRLKQVKYVKQDYGSPDTFWGIHLITK